MTLTLTPLHWVGLIVCAVCGLLVTLVHLRLMRALERERLELDEQIAHLDRRAAALEREWQERGL